MISEFILPPDFRARIEAEARAALPMECCGLIEGLLECGRAIATGVHAVRNIAGDADGFLIDPAEQVRIQRQARAAGRKIIGCYHSHPGGRPVASRRDCENPGADDFIWLIAGVTGDRCEIRAFAVVAATLMPLKLAEPALV